jgi:hypothetical protein
MVQTTLTSPENIFDLEKTALEKLQKFYKTYADYVRCGADTKPDIKNYYKDKGVPCSNTPKTYPDVEAYYKTA